MQVALYLRTYTGFLNVESFRCVAWLFAVNARLCAAVMLSCSRWIIQFTRAAWIIFSLTIARDDASRKTVVPRDIVDTRRNFVSTLFHRLELKLVWHVSCWTGSQISQPRFSVGIDLALDILECTRLRYRRAVECIQHLMQNCVTLTEVPTYRRT